MAGGNEHPNGIPALILLSGLPGAGKTTLAHTIAEALPVVIVESDAIRRNLALRPTYSPEESARVFRVAEEQVREALQAGGSAVLDATNVHTRDRRRFLRLAADLEATLVAVRVTAPEQTVRERLSRPRDGFSEADIAIYEQMRGRVRAFTIPVIVVDTRFDLSPSVDAIRRLIGVVS